MDGFARKIRLEHLFSSHFILLNSDFQVLILLTTLLVAFILFQSDKIIDNFLDIMQSLAFSAYTV